MDYFYLDKEIKVDVGSDSDSEFLTRTSNFSLMAEQKKPKTSEKILERKIKMPVRQKNLKYSKTDFGYIGDREFDIESPKAAPRSGLLEKFSEIKEKKVRPRASPQKNFPKNLKRVKQNHSKKPDLMPARDSPGEFGRLEFARES